MKDNEKIFVLHIGYYYSYWVTRHKIPIRRATLSELLEYCKKNNLNVLTLKHN